MTEPLSEEYVAQAMRDARRFQGCWDQGTSGTLAAHTARLIRERTQLLDMVQQLQDENAGAEGDTLESAWEAYKQRSAATAAASRGEGQPLERVRYAAAGPEVVPDPDEPSPAEELLQKTISVIRDRRPKYGGPREHFKRTVGMVNAAFADVLRRPLTEADWAIIMTLDKVARYKGPGATIDGPVDIAGYAACLYEVSTTDE